MGNERDLPEKELTVVVWSDAEGDESREGVKEAWEAMQVSRSGCRGALDHADLVRFVSPYSTSQIPIRTTRTRIQTAIYRAVGEEGAARTTRMMKMKMVHE